jgi:hypothetical protein
MWVLPNEETYVEPPATASRTIGSVVLRSDDGDTTHLRFHHFKPPVEVAPGQRAVCTLIASLQETPVDEGSAPRSFILACGTVCERGGAMVLKDLRVVDLPQDLSSTQLSFRYL